ncbi:hypothetical protein ACFLRA_00555 [Bdellovibrionota bacterium]
MNIFRINSIFVLIFLLISPPSSAQNSFTQTDIWNADVLKLLSSDDIFDDIENGGGGESGEVGYPPHPRRELRDRHSRQRSESFSARVKTSFMGSDISIGPEISFYRRYYTETRLMAHGEEEIITKRRGKSLFNHDENRRIVFFCTAGAEASHRLTGQASLKIFGTGAVVESGTWDLLIITQESILRYVPFEVSGRETTLEDITSYCNERYYDRSKSSVDGELHAIVSDLVYEHEETMCMEHDDCYDWWWERRGNCLETVGRCDEAIDDDDNPYFTCFMRGTEGAPCPVYDEEGNLRSDGTFEYECDTGFECIMTREWSWYQAAEGECRPE